MTRTEYNDLLAILAKGELVTARIKDRFEPKLTEDVSRLFFVYENSLQDLDGFKKQMEEIGIKVVVCKENTPQPQLIELSRY